MKYLKFYFSLICLTIQGQAYLEPIQFEEIIVDQDNGMQSWENLDVLFEDNEGIFWTSINQGVYRYNGHSAINISEFLSSKYNLKLDDQVTTRFLKKDSVLWLGRRKGLLKLNLERLTVKEIFLDSALHSSNYRNYIVRLQHHNDTLYVGTGNGLYLVNGQNHKIIKKYLTNGVEINHRESSNGVQSMYPNIEEGAIWIVLNNGIYRIDKETDEIEKFNLEGDFYKDKHHFHQGHRYGDVLLMPGFGTGVVQFNLKTRQIKLIKTKENNDVEEEWYDNIARSEITINDSISLFNFARLGNAFFNRNNEQITYFDTPQGMKLGVFLNVDRSGYLWTSKIGRIWRSTKPWVPNEKNFEHIIDVSAFTAGNELKRRPNIEGYDEIVLDEVRNVGVEFTVSKPYLHDTIQYQYQLSNNKWENVSRPNFLSLTKLPSKRHDLAIRALDGKGNVLARRTIPFKINIPFYKTNLFFVMMGLSLFVISFLISQYIQSKKTSKKILELDKMKSNFFANISHELRTPLALISTPIQNRLERHNLSKQERHEFEMILHSNRQLTHLVDQLLDLSKLESGNFGLKAIKTPLTNFFKTLFEPFEYEADSKDIGFTTSFEITADEVFVDRDALQKIVSNLLSNALKYTASKGSISCMITSSSQRLLLVIKNTGKLLTKKQKEQIFNRFYQADEFQQGAGIGLALVKELVDLHNGKITVENGKDGFITFKVVLPFPKKGLEAYEAPMKLEGKILQNKELDFTTIENGKITFEEENEPKPLLLIVDDNKDLQAILNDTFKRKYRILFSDNGESGLKKALDHLPDLILSDVMMPKMTGLELTTALKSHELTSHIPIILLTAKAGEESELLGIDGGADDYITKPFHTELLKTKMSNLIDIRSKMRERYSQEIILKPKDIAINTTEEILLERIQKVLDASLTEPSFSAEAFAKELGFSRMQLHRKLKALTGLSTTEFIRSQRLKLAARLLGQSNKNVTEVCYQIGFNNLSYFTKCFKEAYGVTPSSYSKKA